MLRGCRPDTPSFLAGEGMVRDTPRMKLKNPFPGMNPWLEDHWADVHLSLISYVRDALGMRLPPDLVAEAEEHITIAGDVDEKDKHFRRMWPSRKAGVRASRRSGSRRMTASWRSAAVPLIALAPPQTERWIEIHDFAGRPITVIEILTPGKKSVAASPLTSRNRRAIWARTSTWWRWTFCAAEGPRWPCPCNT